MTPLECFAWLCNGGGDTGRVDDDNDGRIGLCPDSEIHRLALTAGLSVREVTAAEGQEQQLDMFAPPPQQLLQIVEIEELPDEELFSRFYGGEVPDDALNGSRGTLWSSARRGPGTKPMCSRPVFAGSASSSGSSGPRAGVSALGADMSRVQGPQWDLFAEVGVAVPQVPKVERCRGRTRCKVCRRWVDILLQEWREAQGVTCLDCTDRNVQVLKAIEDSPMSPTCRELMERLDICHAFDLEVRIMRWFDDLD